MNKAVDTIVSSFTSQLEEHNKKISELESELESRSGWGGASGATVSMVIVKAEDALETFPAASVAFAVMA